ncbi:MAG TPA: OmpA family protein [Burkholderiaceae bacterium]|nr:OmpA family protein [Burkholderiaceae bacterium]
MSEQNDDSTTFALLVLAAVLALVLSGVLGLALSRALHPAGRAPTALAGVPAGEQAARVYFAVGSDALLAPASETLARFADAARQRADTRVLISGFHDASGDAAVNAELAKRRALAVRHALEANGVAPDRLMLERPVAASAGADAREARRVEIRLR